jgi:hypothetical protein
VLRNFCIEYVLQSSPVQSSFVLSMSDSPVKSSGPSFVLNMVDSPVQSSGVQFCVEYV